MPVIFAFIGAISLLVVIILSFIPLLSSNMKETYTFFLPVFAVFGTLMVSSFILFITSSMGASGHGGHGNSHGDSHGHDSHGHEDHHAAAPAHDAHGHH